MMKKCLLALACLALFCSCKEDNPDIPQAAASIVGAWELSTVATKASVGSETVSVYLSFAEAGTFEIYQKIGAGRYTHFTGRYTLDTESKKLSGSYEDGKAWGPYDVSLDGSSLKLSKTEGKEVDTYRKVDSIPASVTENIY